MSETKDLVTTEITSDEIKNRIYTIRGTQVILDSDLAELYQIETKNLNKAVSRNIERFPEDFCFQLNQDEFKSLKFQIGTSKRRGGRRFLPYAFTEQGVAMLSGVLHSKIAVKVNISIMRTFISMRRFLLNNAQIFQRLERGTFKTPFVSSELAFAVKNKFLLTS